MKNETPTFLGLPEAMSSLETSTIVVLPIPLEKTTSYMKGTSKGPLAILQASAQVEFFDPELGYEPCKSGIFTDLAFAHNPTQD